MNELIDKIEVNEREVEIKLEWLAENKRNGLADYDLNPVVRYLLKKVKYLETHLKIKEEN